MAIIVFVAPNATRVTSACMPCGHSVVKCFASYTVGSHSFRLVAAIFLWNQFFVSTKWNLKPDWISHFIDSIRRNYKYIYKLVMAALLGHEKTCSHNVRSGRIWITSNKKKYSFVLDPDDRIWMLFIRRRLNEWRFSKRKRYFADRHQSQGQC